MRKLFLVCLVALPAFAQTNLYVNTDTGSGTTCSVGSPCASLSVAVAQIPTPTISGPYVIYCAGATADTTAVNVNSHGTTTTNTITITATGAARENGVWSNSAYHLSVSTVGASALTVSDAYINVDGLQIEETGASGSRNAISGAGLTVANFSNLVLRGVGGSASFNGILVSSGSANIWNTVVYNIGTGGSSAAVFLSGTTFNVYSSTLIGSSGYGLRIGSGTTTVKNCYARGASGYAYNGTMTKVTDASADSTGSTGLQTVAYSTANFTNVTGGTEDFHLVGTSVMVLGGTNTSADAAPLNFTTDIAGTARQAGVWDVGAFRYGSAANRHKVVVIR